jgi:hypothetical protein
MLNPVLTGVILLVQVLLAVNIAIHLHWLKVHSKAESFYHLEHDSLAAVHLGTKLLVIKQPQVPHCQTDREAFEEVVSLRILQGLKDLTDHLDIRLF